jgi:hypothetical protein
VSVIDRYLPQELLTGLLAILVTFGLILSGLAFVRVREEVVLGDTIARLPLPLSGYRPRWYVACSLLPTGFLANLLALGRMVRDGETTAVAAGGTASGRVLRCFADAPAPLRALPLGRSVPRRGALGRTPLALLVCFALLTLHASSAPRWLGVWWVQAAPLAVAGVVLALASGWARRPRRGLAAAPPRWT